MRRIHFLLLLTLTISLGIAQPLNFKWAKQLGGSQFEYVCGTAVDASGNVYTAGFFEGTPDFDPGPGTFTLSCIGYYDAYISKIDANGNFVWARQIGSPSIDYAQSIGLDASGNIYITGHFDGLADFDPGVGTYTMQPTGWGGTGWVYVAKLNPSGNLIWVKDLGSSNCDYPHSMTVDAAGNVYTTGEFANSGDFDPGPGTFYLSVSNLKDTYVSKLDANGNFVWAKSFEGTTMNKNYGQGISVDGAGNVYTSGYFETAVDFDPGAGTYTLAPALNAEAYLTKLDASGNFVWAKQMGGVVGQGWSTVIDAAGNVYCSGAFNNSADLDPGPGVFTATGYNQCFVTKLDASGNFVWAKQMGGPTWQDGCGTNSICSDLTGLYLLGDFSGVVDFDPTASTYTMASNAGSSDVFICKLDYSGNLLWTKQMGGPQQDNGISLAIDANGTIYAGGRFFATADFNYGVGYNLTSFGLQDVFIAKFGDISLSTFEANKTINKINVFPNPSNGSFKLQISDDIENGQIILINSLGQKVHEQNISHGQNNINARALSSGIYNYIILNDKEQIGNGKLTID